MEVTEIAGYRVIRQLGAGGMGQVFLVEHPRLPRRDALKLLDAGVSRNDDFKARFQREADLLAQLSHPNIVTLYDRGEVEGRLWITMEFVDGTDAAQLLKARGCLEPSLGIYLVAGAAAALDHAWRKQRITHRDVKPANILVGIDTDSGSEIEVVKLADFGIAKAAGESPSLTSTGMTIGTMQYISPEAIEGEEVDNRSDIYSLGCTAFHLLTGQPPFSGTSIASVMSAHLTKPAPPISKVASSLPEELDVVFQRALAKRPGDRYQSCAEFVAALQAATRDADGYPAFAPTMAAEAFALRTVASTPSTPKRNGKGPAQAATPRSRSRATAIAAAGIAAVTIAAGSLGAFLLLRDTSDTATSPPASPTAATTPTAATPPGVTTPPSSAMPTTTTAVVLPAYPPVDSGCTGTVLAHHDFEHPQLGPMRIFLLMGENKFQMDVGCVAAVMPSGDVLPPISVDAGLGLEFPDPATDATGNLFIEFRSMSAHAPSQVLVLVPSPYGFRELGKDLINIELVGPGADGKYALQHSMNDCTPSCAQGTWTDETLTWDGSNYVA
ncbi:serine/threonine protein kinase [Mycolicibacterium pulveris]|uniref:serine/threonine protein kinase n=1 Tax=Mycolicibacterium pulveris TaxID=36813 RepID=UPI003CF456AF